MEFDLGKEVQKATEQQKDVIGAYEILRAAKRMLEDEDWERKDILGLIDDFLLRGIY